LIPVQTVDYSVDNVDGVGTDPCCYCHSDFIFCCVRWWCGMSCCDLGPSVVHPVLYILGDSLVWVQAVECSINNNNVSADPC